MISKKDHSEDSSSTNATVTRNGSRAALISKTGEFYPVEWTPFSASGTKSSSNAITSMGTPVQSAK